MNVYAKWDTANIADFLDENDKPYQRDDLHLLRPVEIKAIAESGYFRDCFEAKDYMNITLGHDYDFINVYILMYI
jgi:hypothetical protein